jgi:hypothetical protein
VATPPTVSDSPAVQRQYLAQIALTAALVQAIHNLWRVANPLTDDARFRAALYALVQQFGQMSASIGSDFYRGIRAEAGVPGVAKIPAVPSPPRSLVDAGVDWATRARQEMAATEAQILANVEAAMQKAVADVQRHQVVAAVDGDQYAMGFRRVPRPGACYFCIAMAIRTSTRTRQKANGKFVHDKDVEHLGVYKTRASAGAAVNHNFDGDGDAKFHNNCHCVIEPVFFAGVHAPQAWLAEMADLYDTYDVETYGKGLAGFRRALEDFRGGIAPTTPTAPSVALPAASADQIAALLDLLAA